MIQAVISGYGRMGHMVEAALARAGIPCVGKSEDIASFDPDLARESVCIDFTTPDAFKANYKTLAARFKAVVVGTTGWYDMKAEVFAAFEAAGTPMIWGSNYSVGVIALFAGVARACEVLKGHGYTPHVEEIHHIHKLDAPSGTAKSIGVLIEEFLGEKPEIGSQRIGEVPGTHIAEFRSEVDKLTFTHEAFSRQGFAEGAVDAALMTETLTGVHEFKDLIL
jgi:4-hydroxy-tetrahydrodipicolinate reductase